MITLQTTLQEEAAEVGNLESPQNCSKQVVFQYFMIVQDESSTFLVLKMDMLIGYLNYPPRSIAPGTT